MTDSKALIERLRSGRWLGETTSAAAADHIEVLETHNEGYKSALAEQLQIRQQLEADNARLREKISLALQCTPIPVYAGIIYDCGDPWEILRAALQGTSHDA